MTTDTALICPRCELPLKEVRTSGGVFWACDNCGGRAATIELLRNRFTPESINPLWLHAMGGEGRSGVLCPSCRHPDDRRRLVRPGRNPRRRLPALQYIFLFVFGDDVENFLRPLRYLLLIALAAFVADLAHIALDPRSQTPCIDASGGIAGVITFYALNFPRVRLGFLMRWGFVWVRWDPLAGVVGLRFVDFLSTYRRSRTESRHQFRLIGCAFGRRGCGRCRVVTLEKRETQ